MKNTKAAKWLSLLAITVIVAVIGFGVAACNSDDESDGNGDGSSAGKSNWLWAHRKVYTVTDGVAGNMYEYDVTWTSYTDDKHYARQYSYTQPINTRNETATYTQTQSGSGQYSYNDSRDGNTEQGTSHSTYNYTLALTYADPSSSSANSTTSYNSDTTTTLTTVYDNDSGLTKSSTYQQTGTSSTTSNGNTTQTPVNDNYQYSNTIELLSTESSAKTYKSSYSSFTSNGTSADVSTLGYTVNKVQNGITLEQNSYTAEGVLSHTITYSVPDNATIKSKLPNYIITSITVYRSDGSTSTAYQTVEVVSDSNTELRILVKSYSDGKLSSLTEETYRRR